MTDTRVVLLAAISAVIIIGVALLLVRRFGKGIAAAGLDNPERTARLVVAEIAMYHAGALDQARATKTIVRLVKDDLQRSKRMFLQRFPSSEAAWDKAVVDILAHGDASLLGSE